MASATSFDELARSQPLAMRPSKRFVGSPAGQRRYLVRDGFLECFRALVIEVSGEAAGLSESADVEPAGDGLFSMPAVDWFSMIQNAAEELGCPDFGPRLAIRENAIRHDNPFTVSVDNAETLGEALVCLMRNSRMVGCGYGMELVAREDGDWVTLRCRPVMMGGSAPSQVVEYGMLTLYKRLADITGVNLNCEHWFAHAALAPKENYRAFFSNPVRFNMAMSGLHFRHSELDRPVKQHSAAVRTMAEFYISSQYAPAAETFRECCQRLAITLLNEGRLNLDEIAKELSVTRRTLQRRLNEEQTSFSGIREEARRQLALRYLIETGYSLKEVAHRLGYSESSALARSCQRWFSSSPLKIRNSLVA